MTTDRDGPIRILIVDDEADYRDTTAELLNLRYGYQVDGAGSSAQALELARRASYQVALIDHVLREDDLDGIALMEALRAAHPALEFILLTGYGLDPQAKALQAGAYRFVEKGIGLEALHQMIALCVEARRARTELELLRREHALLETLLQLSRATGASLEQGAILQAVYEHLGRLMDVSNIDIALLDKKWGELDFALSNNEGQPEPLRRRPFAFTEGSPGLLDWMIRHRAPILIREYPQDALPVAPHLHGQGETFRSWLGAPLLVEDFAIGAISVQSASPNLYDTTDQRSLMAVANQAAQALYNARLYAEREVLNTISQRIVAVEGVDRLLEAIASEMGQLIDTRNLRIGLHRPDRDVIDLVVRYDDGRRLPPWTLQMYQALLGYTIRSGQPLLLRSLAEVSTFKMKAEIETLGRQPCSWLSAPLHAGDGHVIGAIGVQDYGREGAFDEHDRELLERLANVLAVAVSKAQLLERVQLGLRQRQTLTEIILRLQSERSSGPERGLWAYLTGVTAGYGLGFNRAALFKWEPDPERPGQRGVLAGWLGLGDLDPGAAGETWARMQARGIDSLEAFFRLPLEEPADNPANRALLGERIEVALGSEDCFSQAVFQRKASVLDGGACFPNRQGFWQIFDPGEFAVVPLQLPGRLEGVLVVDNKFTRDPIDAERLDLLVAFSEAIMVAVDNTRLRQERERRIAVLERHYRLITALRSTPRREESLRLLLETLKDLYTLDTCTFGRLTEDGKRLEFDPLYGIGLPGPVSRPVDHIPAETWGRLQGSDLPLVFPNLADEPQVRALLVHPDLRSLAVLPVRGADGRLWGVLTMGRRGAATVTTDDLETLQALAGQAALALRNAELFEEVQLRNRAQELLLTLGQRLTGAVADPLKNLLDEIVQGAQALTGADCVVFYPFEEKNRRYDVERYAAVGLTSERPLKKKLRTEFSMTRKAIKGGLLVVEDVAGKRDRTGQVRIISRVEGFLEREAVRSFAGASLTVGDEPVGVLFVNFRQPHIFTPLELMVIESFANQAAIAIQKDRLVHQIGALLGSRLRVIDGLRQAERLVGLLEKPLEEVWEVILHTALDAAGADRGLFLLFDDRAGQLVPQVAIRIPRNGAEAGQLTFRESGGITGYVAEHKRTVRVGDVRRDKRWKHVYVATVESTRAELAVPILRGPGRELVGVIDLESDREYAFSPEAQKLVEALAAAAAVALANAALYRQADRQQRILAALLKAGQAINSASLDRQATLDRILEEAVNLTEIDGARAHLGAILLWDDRALVSCNIYPPELYAGLMERPLDHLPLPAGVRLPDGTCRIGVAGRAALERRAVNVPDVRADPNYLEYSAETRAELAIPLVAGERLIGVLDIEHRRPGAFQEMEIKALEALAEQAVIAILNAEAYERLDISLRELQVKKNELAASQAVALTGILGSTLAHDIQGYAAAIRDAAKDVVNKLEGQEILPQLADPLHEMLEAANRILAGADRLETALKEKTDRVNLHTLLADRLASWKRTYRQARVGWALDLDTRPPAPIIRANRLLLSIALDNLVNNAVRAMESVEIRALVAGTCRAGERVEIRLRDSGPGIPEEIREKLFKDRVPKENGEAGSGMGLLIVGMILQSFSGEIELESTGPQGTCFVLKLLLEN